MGAERTSRVLRYAARPSRLAEDMDSTMHEMRQDILATMTYYEAEREFLELEASTVTGPSVAAEATHESLADIMENFRPSVSSYWDWLGRMEQDEAVNLEDTVSGLSQERQTRVESGQYLSVSELMAAVYAEVDGMEEAGAANADTVT